MHAPLPRAYEGRRRTRTRCLPLHRERCTWHQTRPRSPDGGVVAHGASAFCHCEALRSSARCSCISFSSAVSAALRETLTRPFPSAFSAALREPLTFPSPPRSPRHRVNLLLFLPLRVPRACHCEHLRSSARCSCIPFPSAFPAPPREPLAFPSPPRSPRLSLRALAKQRVRLLHSLPLRVPRACHCEHLRSNA